MDVFPGIRRCNLRRAQRQFWRALFCIANCGVPCQCGHLRGRTLSAAGRFLGCQQFLRFTLVFRITCQFAKFPLRPRTEAVSQGCTGAKPRFLLMWIICWLSFYIIFQACMGLQHHWLGSVHSIQFNSIQCVVKTHR